MSPSTQQTAAAGRELVARELEMRGARDVHEVTEGRRKELRGVAPSGKRFAVKVKTKRSGTWQPSLSEAEADGGEPGAERFWVLVDLARPRPDFYVVREPDIQEDIRTTHQRAIARHGGRRERTPDSDHHSLELARVQAYKDGWQVIGLEA